MNEERWISADSPHDSLAFLDGKVGCRKLRLLGAAYCRELWRHTTDARSRRAVERAEQFADRKLRPGDLRIANREASDVINATFQSHEDELIRCSDLPAQAAIHVSAPDRQLNAYEVHVDVLNAIADSETSADVVCLAHAALVRDIFGNPFRPMSLSSAHRTPTVTSLARAAYDERHLPSGELDLQRLAVLSDALEEAGAPGEVLEHLRSPGPQVRGCWAIDAILQRA